jgi:hypothetical protein
LHVKGDIKLQRARDFLIEWSDPEWPNAPPPPGFIIP